MNTNSKIALTLVIGVAIGAAAVQGLHAQAKPKAYTVNEMETLDAAANAVYGPKIRAAIDAAGGKRLNSPGGKTLDFVGQAPKRVAINEWESLEKAQAFINSDANKALAAERDKAVKTIRLYAVESMN
jgi:uncharacterized protein (DUF1330 family)